MRPASSAGPRHHGAIGVHDFSMQVFGITHRAQHRVEEVGIQAGHQGTVQARRRGPPDEAEVQHPAIAAAGLRLRHGQHRGIAPIAQCAEEPGLQPVLADQAWLAAGHHPPVGAEPLHGLYARHRIAQRLHLGAEGSGRLAGRPALRFVAQEAQRRMDTLETVCQVQLHRDGLAGQAIPLALMQIDPAGHGPPQQHSGQGGQGQRPGPDLALHALVDFNGRGLGLHGWRGQ